MALRTEIGIIRPKRFSIIENIASIRIFSKGLIMLAHKKLMLPLLIFMLFGIGCSTKDDNEIRQIMRLTMTIEDIWNHKNIVSFKNASINLNKKYLNGVQLAANQLETVSYLNLFFTGFPDSTVKLDNVVLKDNRFYLHWHLYGTNTGNFDSIPPTGKKININGYATILLNKNGKMIQEEVFYNELDLLEQLGYTLKPPNLE